MRRYLSSVMGVLFFLVGLGAAQSAQATTTTLTFDDIPTGTPLTNQYDGIGVTASGAIVISATSTPWPANSGLNVAYAPTGLMFFVLNPIITGNVQTVSAYFSGENSLQFLAYDAGGVRVGLGETPGTTDSLFLSLTSLGNPIASVVIHDGGSSFTIDTLTFDTASAIPEPATAWLLGLGFLGLIGTARRKNDSLVARWSPLLDGATRSAWKRCEFCGSLQATHQPKIAYFHRGGQCT